jgi:hypothetical protein
MTIHLFILTHHVYYVKIDTFHTAETWFAAEDLKNTTIITSN